MINSLDLMTPDTRLGTVYVSGEMDEPIRSFLEGLVVPGGLKPGDAGYLEQLYAILRHGSMLWAQLPG